MKKNKVKFYTASDLGLFTHFPRMREVLDDFLINSTTPKNIEDAIEIQNIIKYIENGIFSRDWDPEYIKTIEKLKPKLEKEVAKYLGTIDRSKILESLSIINIDYRDDFFANFESFNFEKKISEDEFGKMIEDNQIPISYILKSKYFSKTYPNFLKNMFCSDTLNFELLLQNYTKSNREMLYFPENITKAEWNDLLDRYIVDPDANMNYLSMIENPIKNLDNSKYFSVSPKQRLQIKKRSEEFWQAISNSNTGVQASIFLFTNREDYEKAVISAKENDEMEAKEAVGKSIVNSLIASSGNSESQRLSFEMRSLIDRNQLIKDHDFESLLKYFREDWDFFSGKLLSVLPSYPNHEMDVMEKTMGGNKTDNSYEYGFYFLTKHQMAIHKIRVISQTIGEWGIRIEDFIEWFFSKYCFLNYGVKWLAPKYPHSDEDIGNRTATLFRIEENIRKQYLILAEEGEIFSDLVNETLTPTINQLPSFLSNKYVYLSKNKTAKNLLFLLFSDQSNITYVNELINEKNFANLILNHDLKMADFHEFQRINLDYLQESKILEIKDGILRFVDKTKIELLREIYLFGSTSYIHANTEEKRVLDKMKLDDLIIFGETLFSQQESDYLNFMLNARVFDNSWAIRNKYQHGVPFYDNPQQYDVDNFIALLILVNYIVKIDDDLRFIN